MLIKERPIITWLLDQDLTKRPTNISVPTVSIPINYGILISNLNQLGEIRQKKPNWGLPELLMPSFEEVMRKSARSFEKVLPKLFIEFCEKGECGILLCKGNVTLVYSFGGDELHVWYFVESDGKSVFNFYFSRKIVNNQFGIAVTNTILADNYFFEGSLEQRENIVFGISNFILCYVAVKKYGKVEKVVVPLGKSTAVEGTPLEYVGEKKVINKSGQEVIVMDSRWFRKIVNDNDIFVRGFWRLQNKKNEFGEWYKELIFVDSFVRHGYHRNARIEDA